MKLSAKSSDYKAVLYKNARESIERSKNNKWKRKLDKILSDNSHIKDSDSVGLANIKLLDGSKVLFEKSVDKLEVLCNGFILINCGEVYLRLTDKQYKRLKRIKRFALYSPGDKHNEKVQGSYKSLGRFIRRIYELTLTEQLQKKYYSSFVVATLDKDGEIQYFHSIKELLNAFDLPF